ncbi:MAG TPA: hypothetical protein VFO48_09815 [Vicinamibacterales bacterium]|nr:hypothetical protein [Vicinamibacterales bacterium]
MTAAQQQRGGGADAPRPPAVVVPAGRPTVFLWPNGAPGSEARKDEAEGIKGETVVNVHNPSIIVFLPRKEINTGVGLIAVAGLVARGLKVRASGGLSFPGTHSFSIAGVYLIGAK